MSAPRTFPSTHRCPVLARPGPAIWGCSRRGGGQWLAALLTGQNKRPSGGRGRGAWPGSRSRYTGLGSSAEGVTPGVSRRPRRDGRQKRGGKEGGGRVRVDASEASGLAIQSSLLEPLLASTSIQRHERQMEIMRASGVSHPPVGGESLPTPTCTYARSSRRGCYVCIDDAGTQAAGLDPAWQAAVVTWQTALGRAGRSLRETGDPCEKTMGAR